MAVTQEVDFRAEATDRSSERVVAGFGDAVGPTFFRPGSGAVRPDNRAIQGPLLPVNRALCVQFDLEGFEDAVPGAIAAPGRVAVIDGLPLAIAFRDIRP